MDTRMEAQQTNHAHQILLGESVRPPQGNLDDPEWVHGYASILGAQMGVCGASPYTSKSSYSTYASESNADIGNSETEATGAKQS